MAKRKEANEEVLKEVPDFTALVGFWVIQSRMEEGLQGRLLTTLRQWFAEAWAFKAVYYNTNEQNQQQQQLFESCGLNKEYALKVPGRSGQYYVYR